MLENDLKKYSASFMSNTKWRRFFAVVNQDTLEIGFCTWKLVSEDQPIAGKIPDFSKLGDDYVGDCGALNGPFAFREIEWLMLPKTVGYQPYEKAPMKYLEQNIAEIAARIDTIGQFEYDLSDAGLTVFGYKV